MKTLCNSSLEDKIEALDFLSDFDITKIQRWNSNNPVESNSSVNGQIDTHVINQPSHLAVRAWDEEVSYLKLNQRAEILASLLIQNGIGKGDIVPLCMERSAWVVVAMLGVLKCGAAFAALDHSMPIARLTNMLDQVDAKIVILGERHSHLFLGGSTDRIVVGRKLLEENHLHKLAALPSVGPGDHAYIVFTSGTTGVPKGVVLQHRSLCTSANEHGREVGIGPDSKVLHFSSYAYDVSIGEIFTTLLLGGCVCIPSDHDRLNDLVGCINRLGVNWADLTPAVVNLFAPTDVPSLKTLAVGGEAYTPQLQSRWAESVALYNVYGPAECCITCSVSHIRPGSRPGNIGRGTGANLWIVDLSDPTKLCAIGCVGEVLVAGPLVGKGYLKNPEETAKMFIENRFASFKDLLHSRMYRTGDLAHYLSDGSIQFVGRKDTQVKINGQRIELGEIEQAVVSSEWKPGHIAVEVVAEKDKETRLAVFLVNNDNPLSANTGFQPTEVDADFLLKAEDLRKKLRLLLPRHMLPTLYIPVQNIPMSTGGKVDRKALKSFIATQSEQRIKTYTFSGVNHQSPSTDEEFKMQDLWGKVLNLSPSSMSVNDTFLGLGGDSIQAILMVSMAKNSGLSIAVTDIFSDLTLAELAHLSRSPAELRSLPPFGLCDAKDIDDLKRQVVSVCSLADPSLIEDIYPCSPLQEGLMALSNKQKGAYVADFTYVLPDHVDINRLEAAWRQVAQASTILRTRIVWLEMVGMVQVVIREPIRWTAVAGFGRPSMSFGEPLTMWRVEQLSTASRHLIWSIHHALYDGWSMPLILDAVADAYKGTNLLVSNVDFVDYIAYISDASLKPASEAYWKSYLLDAETTIFPRLPSPTYTPHTTSTVIKTIDLPQNFHTGITTASILRASWAMVISRYCGFNDITFGATVNGRNIPVDGINRVIGPCLATVPVRVQLKGAESTTDFLRLVQFGASSMIPHEHFGLQNIYRAIDPKGEAMRMFDSLFLVQPESHLENDTSLLEPMATDNGANDPYAIVFQCCLLKDQVLLRAHIDENVLDRDEMHWIFRLFQTALKGLSTPKATLKEIKLYSDWDISQAQEWNGPVPPLENSCVHDVFHLRANEHPDALSIDSWDAQYTYGQLDSITSRLQRYLQLLGVGPEVKVPICFNKSSWAIIAMISILKAGGAYVPLDPDHPLERQNHIIQEVEGSLVLLGESQSYLADLLRPSRCRVIVVGELLLETLSAQASKASDDLKISGHPIVHPKNAAYILFTSGSTGKPKGVVVEHAAVCTSGREHARAMQIEPSTKFLNFSSLTFDASVAEILTVLMVGGCVCIPSEDERINLPHTISRKHITIALLTPTVASMFQPADFSTLKTLIFCGEPVTTEFAAQWGQTSNVLSVYGPTETCVIVCCTTVTADDFPTGLIGRSIGGSTWLVDNNDPNELVPIGCVGEVVISGFTLARGYLNDQTKTNSAFLEGVTWAKSVLCGHPSHLYKTGDLARYLPNGDLQFLGRKDNQTKVNGQRIELQEIEQAAASFGSLGARFIVEICNPVVQGGQPLLTVFMAREVSSSTQSSGEELSLTKASEQESRGFLVKLKFYLSDRLPRYMVPTLYVELRQLPLSLAGKADRRALRDKVNACSLTELDVYALRTNQRTLPTTAVQVLVRDLWSKILNRGLDAVGIDESFFQLGGDSISAIKLSAAARKMGIQLSVSDIFRASTINQMALVLKNTSSSTLEDIEPFSLLNPPQNVGVLTESLASLCSCSPRDIEDCLPCTPVQEGLIALSIQRPGSYMAQHVFELPADINIEEFKFSWDTVSDMHAILRTRIVHLRDVGSVQVVIRSPIEWGLLNFQEEHEFSCGPLRETQYGSPLTYYALSQDSVSGKLSFVWTIHHSLYDGWSMPLILAQVTKIYKTGEVSSTLKGPRFAHFIEFLQRDNTLSKTFWIDYLRNAKPQLFPRLPDPSYQTTTDAFHMRNVSMKLAPDLRVTKPNVVRAAWALVMGRHMQTDDVVFGVTLSGRNAPVSQITSMIAPTITTLPVRVSINSHHNVQEYLTAVQQQAVKMMGHEHIGLQNITRLVPTSDAMACSFNNLLVIQPESPMSEQSELMIPISNQTFMAETYSIVMECIFGSGQVVFCAHYDTRVLSKDEIDRILCHFEAALNFLCRSPPDTRISQLDICTEEDKSLIMNWNQPHAANTSSTLLLDEFKARVQKNPSALALESSEGTWTYAELDSITTRVTQHLIHRGIRAETRVPTCFGKSAWAIIATLAIFKAGGVYVPLDPKDSPYRHRMILTQIGSRLLLTSSSNISLFAGSSIDCLVVDADYAESLQVKSSPILPSPKPNDAAYIIFTSGSTGNPKGVVIEHAALSSGIISQREVLFLDSSSRVFQYTAFTFDVSLTEILATLISGGCICMPSDDERDTDIAASMRRLRVNWAFFTPSVVFLLKPQDIPSLQTLVLGGETVTYERAKEWTDSVRVIIGYGPTEACIFSSTALVNQQVFVSGLIGTAVGGVNWIVESQDPSRLTPVGCVGEIAISGPTLARHYLDDMDKTTAAFVGPLQWFEEFDSSLIPRHRLYLTGDLGKYNFDGSITYLGRKDSQVKVNGRRLELGEIESHLYAALNSQKALVLLPKSGPFAKKLTAILEYEHEPCETVLPANHSESNLELVPSSRTISQRVSALWDSLNAEIPEYMSPTEWVVVKQIPISLSGKLNRSTVSSWIESLTMDTYKQASFWQDTDGTDKAISVDETPNPIESRLQKIWAQVLGRAHVGLHTKFSRLGGDSISAIQVATRCRKEGYQVSVQEIVRNSTISQLARVVRVVDDKSCQSRFNEDGSSFELSPVQRFYFDAMAADDVRFNQSFMLIVSRPVEGPKFALAIESLVLSHPMLRARFNRSGNGHVSQYISKDVQGSYVFSQHTCQKLSDTAPHIDRTQKLLDPFEGPLLAATIFDLPEFQVLFITAHHLVIDLVSWRIMLQELEDFNEGGMSKSAEVTSFHEWTVLQSKHATASLYPSATLSFMIPEPDLSYWDVELKSSTFGDTNSKVFSLDLETTSSLLGSSNLAFNTEPIEIMLAAIFASFSSTFLDRAPPAIFIEGHGREPWEEYLDVSSTVGWFTTIYPCFLYGAVQYLNKRGNEYFLHLTRQAKDVLRSIPNRGQPYFASQFNNEPRRSEFADHSTMEILFNYHGSYQQLERSGALFQNFGEDSTVPHLSSISDRVRRPSLIDVSASFVHGHLEFEIVWFRGMNQQQGLADWADSLHRTLISITKALTLAELQYTLCDFPHSLLEYDSLDDLTSRVTKAANGDNRIEDIYPCLPLQQRMYTLQNRFPQLYRVQCLWEVSTASGAKPDCTRIAQAWEHLVSKHAVLRSHIHITRNGAHQVVLTKPTGLPRIHSCKSDKVSLNEANSLGLSSHQLDIYDTFEGNVYCLLQISHLMSDATSLAILLRQLVEVYEGKLPEPLAPSYRSLLEERKRPGGNPHTFWAAYLAGRQPCLLPTNKITQYSGHATFDLQIQGSEGAQEFCQKNGVTLSTLLQTAWAMCLRHFTGSEDVVFGYFTSGRDRSLPDIENIVGLCINLVPCCVSFSRQASLLWMLERVHNSFVECLPYHSSATESIAEQRLFNTVFNFQKPLSSTNIINGTEPQQSLKMKYIIGSDPMEVSTLPRYNTCNIPSLPSYINLTELCDSSM